MCEKDILTMDLRPFPENLMERMDALRADHYNPALLIRLCILYIERLTAEDTGIQFPAMEISAIQTEMPFSWQNVAEIMEELNGFLSESFVEWSSFGMENIPLDGLENLCEVDTEDLMGMDSSRRRDIIWEHREQLLTRQQQELFRVMPEPLLDCLDCSYDRGALYFFNPLLTRYLNFVKENADVVRQVFAHGHERIKQATECLACLAEPDWVQVYIRESPCYTLGFGYGIDVDGVFTAQNIEWNFYVAVYILEKLLNRADCLFGFCQEGGGYGEK